MDSNIIYNANIYEKLRSEYCRYLFSVIEIDPNATSDWREFIEHKNIGIVFREDLNSEGDIYQITDHHRYMLAKIKYGF